MATAPRPAFVCQPVSTHHHTQRGRIDVHKTALREAAYIRRTRFTKGETITHDFSLRGEDLFMLASIVPLDAPQWAHRPFLRWQMADEAAEADGKLDGVRAWHVCGDLKPGLTRGEWADQVETLVRRALPLGAVGEIAGHLPRTKPPHAHILVAARYLGQTAYEAIDYGLYDRLTTNLRSAWMEWLQP